ncbi:hypothetical protein V6N11_041941 [Hibiscus sabdariffa]|uniref:Uncharacterized protein n=2 Tax=Hibiscus sabdariffa TaxID=183260 RepID=A0ABR2BVA9_9ROSI
MLIPFLLLPGYNLSGAYITSESFTGDAKLEIRVQVCYNMKADGTDPFGIWVDTTPTLRIDEDVSEAIDVPQGEPGTSKAVFSYLEETKADDPAKSHPHGV